MVRAAPRVDQRLVELVVSLDDGTLPVAEICRRAGAFADAAGLTQPSYESVRSIVHLVRAVRASSRLSELREIWEASVRGGYMIAFDQVVRAVGEIARRTAAPRKS